jgi:hypothetical protein
MPANDELANDELTRTGRYTSTLRRSEMMSEDAKFALGY